MQSNKRKKSSLAFGVALREVRSRLGLSQEALAHNASVDRTYISMLELGQRSPKLDTMLSIAAALNTDLRTLIARVEEILGSDG